MTCATIENLVIGGGPAGSMLALRLSDAGRPVTLLEKERTAHHKVCGEFLSGEAVEYLDRAGISACALGAVPIDRVRLSSGKNLVESPLPFRALSLSRHVLDEAMLHRAQDAGCSVRRGACVGELEQEGDAWRVELRAGATLRAQTVFLATGKHDLRGWARGCGVQSDLIGFKLHWRLRPAQTELLRGAMELFLFPGGYGGLAMVEGEVANLCLVVQRRRLQAEGGWTKLLEALRRGNRHLRARLEGGEPLWERPLAISPIPYGYLANGTEGLWRVGDQAAVIPSFTGDGMSIAMHSAALAAQMYMESRSMDECNRTLHAQLHTGMQIATTLSRGLVTDLGRSLAPLASAILPGGMRWIAAATRIPEGALEGSRTWPEEYPVLG
ncbi:MAG: NAD(P)/FAD-dependent oxidoreductase [Terracidiphilus sp.]